MLAADFERMVRRAREDAQLFTAPAPPPPPRMEPSKVLLQRDHQIPVAENRRTFDNVEPHEAALVIRTPFQVRRPFEKIKKFRKWRNFVETYLDGKAPDPPHANMVVCDTQKFTKFNDDPDPEKPYKQIGTVSRHVFDLPFTTDTNLEANTIIRMNKFKYKEHKSEDREVPDLVEYCEGLFKKNRALPSQAVRLLAAELKKSSNPRAAERLRVYATLAALGPLVKNLEPGKTMKELYDNEHDKWSRMDVHELWASSILRHLSLRRSEINLCVMFFIDPIETQSQTPQPEIPIPSPPSSSSASPPSPTLISTSSPPSSPPFWTDGPITFPANAYFKDHLSPYLAHIATGHHDFKEGEARLRARKLTEFVESYDRRVDTLKKAAEDMLTAATKRHGDLVSVYSDYLEGGGGGGETDDERMVRTFVAYKTAFNKLKTALEGFRGSNTKEIIEYILKDTKLHVYRFAAGLATLEPHELNAKTLQEGVKKTIKETKDSNDAKIIEELNSIGVVYVENKFIFSKTEGFIFKKITDKKIKLEKDGESVIRENIDEVQIGIEQIGDKIKISSSPNLIFESIESGGDELDFHNENKWLLKYGSDGNITFTINFQYKGEHYKIERDSLIDNNQIQAAKTVKYKLKQIGILYDEGTDEFIVESQSLIDFTTERDEDKINLIKESVTVTIKKNEVDEVNVQIEQHGDKLKVTNIPDGYVFESLLYDQDKNLTCDDSTCDLKDLDGEIHFFISITKNDKSYRLKRTLNIKGNDVQAAKEEKIKVKFVNILKKKALKMKAVAAKNKKEAAEKVQRMIRRFQEKKLKAAFEKDVNENCQFLLEPVDSTNNTIKFGSIDNQNFRVYKNYLKPGGYFKVDIRRRSDAKAYRIVNYHKHWKTENQLVINLPLKRGNSITITKNPKDNQLCHYDKTFVIKVKEGKHNLIISGKNEFEKDFKERISIAETRNKKTFYVCKKTYDDVTIENNNSWLSLSSTEIPLKIIFAVKQKMLSGGDDFSDDGAYSPTTVMTEDLLSDDEEEEQQEEKPKFRVVEVQLGAGRSWRKALSLEKDGYYRVFTGAGRSRVVAVPSDRVRPDSTQAKGDLVYDVRGCATRLVQRMLPDGPEAPPVYAVRNLNHAPFGRGPFAPRVLLLRADEVRAPTEKKLLAGGQALSTWSPVSCRHNSASGSGLSSTVRTEDLLLLPSSRPSGPLPAAGPVLVGGGRGGLRMATFDGETVDADGRLACTFATGERGWVNPANVFVDNLKGGELVREKAGGVYRLVQRDADGRCWVRNLNRSRFGGIDGPTLKAIPASELWVVEK